MIRQMLTLGVFLLAACAQVSGTGVRVPVEAEPLAGPEQSQASELMDRLVGHWVMTGVVAGENVVHDVDAAWALQGNYIRINEVARERDENGQPQYEATIFIGWLETEHHYVCFWFDNTGVASGLVTCAAQQEQDSLPFEVRDADGTLTIATTFSYHRADDAWEWQIDNVYDDHVARFATLSLHRR